MPSESHPKGEQQTTPRRRNSSTSSSTGGRQGSKAKSSRGSARGTTTPDPMQGYIQDHMDSLQSEQDEYSKTAGPAWDRWLQLQGEETPWVSDPRLLRHEEKRAPEPLDDALHPSLWKRAKPAQSDTP